VDPEVRTTTEAQLPEEFDEESNAGEWTAAGVQDNETEGDLPPIDITKNVTRSCEVLKVNLGNGTVATVLKIRTFGLFSKLFPCLEAAVEQASELSNGSLILDVISNGGGYISTGYYLNEYLYYNMQFSSLKDTWDTCEWYDFPRNEQLDWLVSLSQKASPFGGDRGMEIMGYRWSNKFPEPLSQPNWDYYTDTVTKIRGGEPRNFSSWTFLGSACAAYRSLYPKAYGSTVLTEEGWPITPQSKVKHITYLSDGLCGSTCSVSSTRPFVDGLATFVTFGGVKGEPMDITSFNGGNVATYQAGKASSYSLWKDALDSVVDAHAFFPDDKAPSWPFMPIPLNIYKVGFAQRAEYLRALGPKALPREWYLIPASYHLDIWPGEVLTRYKEASPTGKRTLFELYKATAALPPKPLAVV